MYGKNTGIPDITLEQVKQDRKIAKQNYMVQPNQYNWTTLKKWRPSQN